MRILPLIAVLLLTRTSAAQEELLGKTRSEAILYLDSAKIPFVVSKDRNGMGYSVDSIITTTQRSLLKWYNHALMRVGVRKNDTICVIELQFHELGQDTRMTRKGQKQAIKELTKQFGEPKSWYYMGDDVEEYKWETANRTYTLYIGQSSGACEYEVSIIK